MSDFNLIDIVNLIRAEIRKTQVGPLKKVTGPTGEQGPMGESGPQGAQGPRGNDGKQGPKGDKGIQGKQGPAGPAGKDGSDGIGIARVEQGIDEAVAVYLTDGTVYTIEMPFGKNSTEVHYKVSGSGSGSGGGGTVDLSNYVQKPSSNAAWMVYKKGTGWTPVTTDLVATNPAVIFRDAKGRFKSTKELEALTNQLEVNRYFAEQLEAVWQALGSGGDSGNGGPPGAELHAADGMLIIGGGGGGGSVYAGGGGGAGGWIWEPLDIKSGDNYLISPGAGGVSTNQQNGGTKGTESLVRLQGGFVTQAEGGGFGSSLDGDGGGPGGSGGGSSYRPSYSPGGGTAGQGNAGGLNTGTGVASGGGGADEVGGGGSNAQAGKGGDGKMSDITGEQIYYAGGGPGGNQPGYGSDAEPSLGGGAVNAAGEDGKGAGGAGANSSGGHNGGDGVVIVRSTLKAKSTSGSPEVTEDGEQTVYIFTGMGELNF